MASRFDEIEIVHIDSVQAAPTATLPQPARALSSHEPLREVASPLLAPRWRRAAAFLIDSSLFAATALALTPLLPRRGDVLSLLETELLSLFALAGFLLLLSFYYFFGAWLIWGRTIGGAMLDVRVVSADGSPLDARSVSKRWAATVLSVVTGFVGFAPALLPSRRSVPDRVSDTLCVLA